MQVAFSMSSSCSAIIDAVRSLLYHVFSLGSALPAWISVSEMITAPCLQLELRVKSCKKKKTVLQSISILLFNIPCEHPIHSLILPQCKWIGGEWGVKSSLMVGRWWAETLRGEKCPAFCVLWQPCWCSAQGRQAIFPHTWWLCTFWALLAGAVQEGCRARQAWRGLFSCGMTRIHRTGPNLRVLDIQLPIEDSSSPVERHEKKKWRNKHWLPCSGEEYCGAMGSPPAQGWLLPEVL